MNCPVCDGKLREVQKYGVTVDICPDCKGVWLDRGELEKIIEMVSTEGPVQSNEQRKEYERPRYEKDNHEHSHEHEHYDEKYKEHGYQKKRRGSWLADLMEGFGGD